MVFGIFLALLILVGILLMVVVLLQSGKGGGLAAMGGASLGTEGMLGGHQAATLLTKATWWLGGIFMVLAFGLSVLSSRTERPRSILREEFQQTAPAPAAAPVLPGTQAPTTTPGAAPATPQGAAPAPTPQTPPTTTRE